MPLAVPMLLAVALGLIAVPARAIEALQVGTSSDRIEITSEFSGGELIVFGAVENAEEERARRGSYDIVVVLEGPRQPVVVRRKERVLGFWINRGAETLELAPASYVLASTRHLGQASTDATRRQLALGPHYLRLSRQAASTPPTLDRVDYSDAFLAIKEGNGLYNETAGAVEFVAPTLFRARLALPRNLPVGRHMVRVLLFDDGTYLVESSRALQVVMTGSDGLIQHYANESSWLYGVFAVLLGIFVGWFGRIAFRRD